MAHHILRIYPNRVKTFLDRCFPIEPQERWTASQLLEHEFLAGVAKKAKNRDAKGNRHDRRFRHLGEGVARSTEF